MCIEDCEGTCDVPRPVCKNACIRHGCKCGYGLVRDERTNKCIPLASCPVEKQVFDEMDDDDDDSSGGSCSSARLQQGILDRPNGIRRDSNPFSFSDLQGAKYVDMKQCFQKQFDSCCSVCTGEFLYDRCWQQCTGKNHFTACWEERDN